MSRKNPIFVDYNKYGYIINLKNTFDNDTNIKYILHPIEWTVCGKLINNFKKSQSDNFTEGVFKIQNFIVFSFTMINTLKLYHWTTNIYSRHKSIDDLIDKLQNLIDSFVESYLGKKESETRGDSIEIFKNNFDLTISIINDNTIKNEINNYMKYIKKCCNDLNSNTDTELINILDEISSSLNTGIYLSNLK